MRVYSLISKVAEEISKFIVRQFIREVGLDWHAGECVRVVHPYKMQAFHIVTLSQNAVPKVVDSIFFHFSVPISLMGEWSASWSER